MKEPINITGVRSNGEEFRQAFPINSNELDLSNNDLISVDLSPLQELTILDKLYLQDNQLKELDLSPLEFCPALEELDLSNNQLQYLDLVSLQNCRALEKLFLNSNQLEELDLTPLQLCTNLAKLNISNNKLKALELDPLRNCRVLAKIRLENNRLRMVDLSPLRDCSVIDFLDLNGNQIKHLDLSPLKKWSNLEDLNLGNNELSHLDLHPLQHCENLNHLSFGGNQLSSLDLSPLQSASALESLTLHNNRLKFLDLTPIQYCESVNSVSLDNNQFSEGNQIFWHIFLGSDVRTPEYPSKGLKIVLAEVTTDKSKWYLNPGANAILAVINASQESIHFILHEDKALVEKSRSNLRFSIQQDERPFEGFIKFAESIIASPDLLVSFDDFQQFRHPLSRVHKYITKIKENIFLILYILLGISVVFSVWEVFSSYWGLNQLVAEDSSLQLMFLLFLGLQLFLGIMIQSYIDGLLGKGELVFKQRTRIMLVLSRLHRNFGVLVGILWILTLYSLFSVSSSFLAPSSVVATWDIVYFILIFAEFLQIQFNLSILSLPLLELLASIIFTSFIGLLIRVVSILSLGYAIFSGGWKVPIHPSQTEPRLLQKRWDWLSRWLVLIFGLFLAFLAIGYDQTLLSQLPIDIFKIGIFIGGLGYALLNRRQSIGFFQTVSLLVILYYCVLVVSFILPFLTGSQPEWQIVGVLLLLLFWIIINFVFYFGGYPFKRPPFKYSALRYMLRANEGYQQVWVRGARSRAHRWLFGENNFLLAYHDDHRGTWQIKIERVYPMTVVTIGLVLVIPLFSILVLTACSIKFISLFLF